MADPNPIGRLAQAYDEHPTVQSLIGLVPGSGALMPLLHARAEQINHERMRDFFDELARGRVELTSDLIESEDFLHSYFSTLRAASRTRSRQKIRYLARLFRSAVLGADYRDADDYEELLGTLDELSLRELRALVLLDQESGAGDMLTVENREEWRRRIRDRLTTELAVAAADLPGFLARLQRSGLFSMAAMHVDGRGQLATTTDTLAGFGELSPRYYRLRSYLEPLDSWDSEPSARPIADDAS